MAGTGGPRIPAGKGNGGTSTEIQLRLPEQVAGGAYANGMMVQHTSEEFVLDFTMVMGGSGAVVSRVITSPVHAKAIAGALQENIRRYETSFGPIKGVGSRPRPGAGPQLAGGEDD